MRSLPTVFLLALIACKAFAATPEETEVIAAAQRLFDAMVAHDGAAMRAGMLPEARFFVPRDNGELAVSSPEQFAERIAASKDHLLERMWKPEVRVRGRIATVWAEYDFHRNGTFSHCGIDSFTLVKTPAGWKIAAITYTMEKTGCAPSPLGPPSAAPSTK